MTVQLIMLVVLTVFPPKPDLAIRLNDISITQALNASKLVGVKLDLPIKLEGRIGKLAVTLHGQFVVIDAKGISMAGDPVRWVKAVYHRRTEQWYMKAEAFGGFIEVEGVIPK